MQVLILLLNVRLDAWTPALFIRMDWHIIRLSVYILCVHIYQILSSCWYYFTHMTMILCVNREQRLTADIHIWWWRLIWKHKSSIEFQFSFLVLQRHLLHMRNDMVDRKHRKCLCKTRLYYSDAQSVTSYFSFLFIGDMMWMSVCYSHCDRWLIPIQTLPAVRQ